MVKTFLRSVYTRFATNILDRPGRLLAFLFFMLFLIFPVTRPTKTILSVMIPAFIMGMFAASWDLLVGRCGQISLGHSLFLGIGAYTTGVLFTHYGLPIYVTIPVAVIVGTLFAVPVSFPAIRLKGPFLSLISMALPLIALGIVLSLRDVKITIRIGNMEMMAAAIAIVALIVLLAAWWKFTSPTKTKKILAVGTISALIILLAIFISVGIFVTDRIHDDFSDVTKGNEGILLGKGAFFFPTLKVWYQQWQAEYLLALFLLLICGSIIYRIANSRTGIVFVSILDDELASKACGIDVTKYKIMAFAISAFFASLTGAYFAHSLSTGTAVAPLGTFAITMSFLAVIFTTLGGIGTIYGPIAGAFIVTFLNEYVLGVEGLNIPIAWRPLSYIIPVIIILIKWPRGVARFVTDQLDDLSEERLLEERGKWIWKRKKVK